MEYLKKNYKKKAILLINLGTPKMPTVSLVKKYLKQFLSDRRVIELTPILWQIILRMIILPIRSKKTTKLYQKIWCMKQNKSPLMFYTESLAIKLNQLMNQNIIVDFAMRYSYPSIENKIKNLCQRGIREIKILPLYPQYSATTTASVYDEIYRILSKMRRQPNIIGISPYYDNLKYIKLLASTICNHIVKLQFTPDVLLFSFHGIPKSYCEKGDPYYHCCKKTYELTKKFLRSLLKIKKLEFKISFQSRFGPLKWIQPYTTDVLENCAKSSQCVVIVTPGFSTDCLETLEELQVTEYKKFIDKGGKNFSIIPCFNDSNDHIKLLQSLVL